MTTQFLVNPERPIRDRLFDPLFDIQVNKSISAPSRQPMYLKLIQNNGQPQQLRVVYHRWEKSSLNQIAQAFAPPALYPVESDALTIGEQISQEVHRYDIDLRMAAVFNQDDKKKLGQFVSVMINYLVSYSDTLWFKIRVILARILPWCFSSPEVMLLDRLSAVARIAAHIESQYEPFPPLPLDSSQGTENRHEPTPYDEFKALARRCAPPRVQPPRSVPTTSTVQTALSQQADLVRV